MRPLADARGSASCTSRKPPAEMAQAPPKTQDASLDKSFVFISIVARPGAMGTLLPAASRLPGFGPVPGVSTPVPRADSVAEGSVGMSACATSLHAGLGSGHGWGIVL
jgi:hypothetical protein